MNNYRTSNYSSGYMRNYNPYVRNRRSYPEVQAESNPANDEKNDCEMNSCNMNNTNMNNCNMNNLPLAMAYVPWQEWSKPLSASEGLYNGTIFPELILPFKGCCKNNIMPRGGRR